MSFFKDSQDGVQGGLNETITPRPRPRRPQTDHAASMFQHVYGNRLKGRRLEAERSSPSYILNMMAPLGRKANAAFSLPSKHLHSSLNKQKHPINAIKWTPDGRRLLTGNSSGEFTLWNGMGFNFETLMQAHDSAVRAFAWSHDDDWLLSADQDGIVKYWQSNFNPVNVIEAHKGYAVRDIAFAPTDVKFVTAADDTTLRIWDFENPTDTVNTLKGHGWDVKAVDWHPNKGLIASGSKDHTVKLWDPRTCRCLTSLNGQATVSAVVFEPQKGNGLAISARNNVARVFDLRMMRDVLFLKGHDRDIMSLCWHPIHANMLSTGGIDGSLFHYLLDEPNAPDGKEGTAPIPICDSREPESASPQHIYPAHRVTHAHDAAIWSMDWHPLGHVLATGSNDRVTRFWSRARPGEVDCFNDRYHLGDAGADAHGNWTRRSKRNVTTEDYDQEGDEGDEGIVDQRMPAQRLASGTLTGFPSLPGLPGIPGLGNGDSVVGSQFAVPQAASVPQLPMPIPPPPPPFSNSFSGPGTQALGGMGFDQLSKEAQNQFLEMIRSQRSVPGMVSHYPPQPPPLPPALTSTYDAVGAPLHFPSVRTQDRNPGPAHQ